MKPKNPQFAEQATEVFHQANFIRDLGIQLAGVGPGWCETELEIQPRHLQQDGVVHAGVQSTMADHTAGGAAASLVAANEYVLTLEFKMNLLRAAQGTRLRCRAQVLKPGSRFTVVESEVFAVKDTATLVAKGTVTLAIMQR